MVIEKEIGFEVVEVGDFEPPAGNTAKQDAQHGFISAGLSRSATVGKKMSQRLTLFSVRTIPNTRAFES